MSEDEEEVRPMRTMSNYEHFCSSQEDIAFTLESKVVEEVMFDPTTTQKMLSLEDFLHSSDFDSDSSGEENGYHHRSQPSNTGIANIMRFSENLHGRYVQRNQQHYQSNQETLEDDVLLCSEAVSAPYMPYHMSHEVDSDDYKYYSSDSSTEDEESDGDYDVHQFGYDGYLDQAIRDDDLVYVSHLLEVLQSTDSSGVSAEHMLTTFCDEIQSVEMLRLFVETGVDVRYYLDTATSIRPDLLIFLVEVVGADFNSCCDGTDPDQDIADDEDTGPISIMLSYYQQPDMLRYLLSNGANIQATHNGDNILTAVIKQYHEIYPNQDFLQTPPSRLGFLRSCNFLLDAGVDVNFRSREDKTALLLAVLHEDFLLTNLLLEHHANANEIFKEERNSIIMEKIAASHFSTSLSQQHHKSITFQQTVRVSISEANEISVLTLLTKQTPSVVDIRNQMGESALMFAFRYGGLKYIKLLVEAGITITEEDLDYLDDMPAFEEEDCFMVFDEICALTRSAYRLKRGVYRYIPDYIAKSLLDVSTMIFREQIRLANTSDEQQVFETRLHQTQQLLHSFYNRTRFHRLSCSGEYLKLNIFGQLEWIFQYLLRYQQQCVETISAPDLRNEFQTALLEIFSDLQELRSYYY